MTGISLPASHFIRGWLTLQGGQEQQAALLQAQGVLQGGEHRLPCVCRRKLASRACAAMLGEYE